MGPDAKQRQHDHTEMEAALVRAAGVLDEAGIDYAVMGGLASAAVGRARHTHDLDLFVRREDALPGLEALGRAGFRTERRSGPPWPVSRQSCGPSWAAVYWPKARMAVARR